MNWVHLTIETSVITIKNYKNAKSKTKDSSEYDVALAYPFLFEERKIW